MQGFFKQESYEKSKQKYCLIIKFFRVAIGTLLHAINAKGAYLVGSFVKNEVYYIFLGELIKLLSSRVEIEY